MVLFYVLSGIYAALCLVLGSLILFFGLSDVRAAGHNPDSPLVVFGCYLLMAAFATMLIWLWLGYTDAFGVPH